MPTKILIKRSTTAGVTPTTSDIDTGEFAINTVDKRIYTNNQGTIVELGTYPSQLNVTGATDLDGTLNVDGVATLASGSVTGNWSVAGTLSVSTPVNSTDAASKGYVDAQIDAVLDSAPAALDTLNELAAALNDDANFATTMTNALATKLNLSGGTMSGDITLGSNKATSTANPATDDTLTRKGYVDSILGSSVDAATSAAAAASSATAAASSESAASASETNAASSSSSASTSATNAASSASAANTSASSASNSATAAAASATSAANSATAAASSATAASADATATAADVVTLQPILDNLSEILLADDNAATATTQAGIATTQAGVATLNATSAADSASSASTSASNAAASATSAQASLDEFQGQYHGALATAPSTGVDTGDLYFDTVLNEMRVYDGSAWKSAGSTVNGTAVRQSYTATAGQTAFTVTGGYDSGFADVYLNGVKLVNGVDVDVTSGTGFTLTTGATAGDVVDFIGYGAFEIANTYTQSEIDSTYGSEGRTQSSTDTTAGRLLKVGDFGIGAIDTWVSAPSLDSNFANGLYRFDNGITYGLPFNVGSIINQRLSGTTAATQLATNYSNGDVYSRSQAGGSWKDWVKLYNQSNILGTVSQSAGVPTGAIIERGSNANGEYVKYADGTLICTASTLLFTYSSVNELGFGDYSFPAVFVAKPAVSLTPSGAGILQGVVGAGALFRAQYLNPIAWVTSSSGAQLTLNTNADLPLQSGDEFEIALIAIGRWY
jgi:hypothetical protein